MLETWNLLWKVKKQKKQFLTVFILALLLWGGFFVCKINLTVFLEGIPQGIDLLRHTIPPQWKALPELIKPALETVQIAFVGTVFGAILSFFLGLAGASNLSPKIIREPARGIIILERALPDLVIMLLFVAAVGLGPFPGVMALAICSIGMLGKLFAESIEEIDPRPSEALEAVGATKSQIIRYAILPQTLPSFVANTLYRFDVNIRMSILIGAVGAGGIGYELLMSMGLLKYKRATIVLIVILLLIVCCEKISDALRKRIIGQETLR